MVVNELLVKPIEKPLCCFDITKRQEPCSVREGGGGRKRKEGVLIMGKAVVNEIQNGKVRPFSQAGECYWTIHGYMYSLG
jgi:hypothetical protein